MRLTKLAVLGRDSDQLSRISKRELANAMQRVAYDSAKLDPPLALAEDAVQRALNRQVYSETKASLENLAKTVTDTKNGVVSQEALAKSLDQLQQSQAPTPGGGAGDSADYVPDIPGTEPNQVGLVKGAPSTISVPGPEGDPTTATRSGTGQNPGGDPLGDLTSRLNLPPIDISVDAQLANDKGRQTANPAGTDGQDLGHQSERRAPVVSRAARRPCPGRGRTERRADRGARLCASLLQDSRRHATCSDSMTLLAPVGLWFLLALPVIFILYLIQSRYRPQVVASLMLWKHMARDLEAEASWRRPRWDLLLALQLLVALRGRLSRWRARPCSAAAGSAWWSSSIRRPAWPRATFSRRASPPRASRSPRSCRRRRPTRACRW